MYPRGLKRPEISPRPASGGIWGLPAGRKNYAPVIDFASGDCYGRPMQSSVVSHSPTVTGLGLDLAFLEPQDAAGWACLIAARLARGDLATRLLGALAGREITLRSIGPHLRPADFSEAAELRMHAGDGLYVRDGLLLAGTVTCARTTLKLIPHRLEKLAGPGAWAAVRCGRPCGDALERYGLAPGNRDIGVRPGGDPPVTARRLLVLRGGLIGVVTEEIPLALCQYLADRGRQPRG